jgi:hypothetical protein
MNWCSCIENSVANSGKIWRNNSLTDMWHEVNMPCSLYCVFVTHPQRLFVQKHAIIFLEAMLPFLCQLYKV